jgi:regulator of sigma E protease
MSNQLVQFIIGIAILILLHEFGHFVAAKIFKIEVEEFGIGFPPRLIKLFTLNRTLFSLNCIPLGGFVKIKGENDPEVGGGLAAAKPWTRVAVMAAGPITNLLLGLILSIILFYSMGEPILNKVIVQYISPGSPAEQAGLQVNDLIMKVGDQNINSTDQLLNLIYSSLGTPITIEYQRGEQTFAATLTPRNPPPDDGAVGIMIGNPTQPTTWLKAFPKGFITTYEYGKAILLLPVSLIKGEITPEEARPIGYKGMFDIYQKLQNPLWFFMMITMSLGIFNLFPIPALDGGRILLTLPELIIHKRVPARYENVIHFIGFAILLALLIIINIQDFINPVKLPF